MTFIIPALAVLALLVLAWLYMVLPASKPRKMSEFFDSPIAHRGIHDADGVAENSIAAYDLAIQKGYPIEIDIRVTADGAVYVLHDDGLSRLCGVDGRLSSVTAEEAEELRLSEGGEKIPTLRELLDFVDGRVPLLIELKGEKGSVVSEKSYEILKDYKGKYAIQSFNPYLIRRYRCLTKDIPIGILAERGTGKKIGEKVMRFFLGSLMFNFMYRPDFVSYKHTDSLPVSAKLCRFFGTHLLCWTVRDKESFDKAQPIYDGIICENIDKLL